MRRICTVTGKCPEKFPCVKNADGTLYSEPRPCPYYTRTGLAEVIDWRERYEEAKQGLMMWQAVAVETDEAFSNMAAAFEELAGEHRELLEYCQRLLADNAHSQPECPGPGWYWTRGYWTPPRSRVSPNGETAPTSESSAPSVELCKTEVGDTDDTGEAINGPPGASGGQPEVFQPVCNPGQTLWQCEDCGQVVSRLDHDCEGAEG